MSLPFKEVLTQREGHVLVIAINRPEAMNALNNQTIAALSWMLDEARDDGDVRVVILTGVGPAFCSGGQLKGSRADLFASRMEMPEGIRQGLRQAQRLVRSVVRLEKPTVAMVNGPALGAGLSLALACDIRIASERAQFAVSYTRVGIIPGTGDTWLLPRLIGPGRAAEMLFTGDPINAMQAERYGIVNRVVAADQLEIETMKLAHRIAQGPPIALRLDKMLLYRGLSMDFEAALDMIAASEASAWISEDKREGIAAFQEKREPNFRGR